MTKLTRRHVLAATAAFGASAAAVGMPSTARAAAPVAGKQVAGFYRYKVGDIEVTVVTDGANRLPVTDAFVTNVKKEEVNAALAAAFMEPGFFIGPYNPVVINTGSKLALVDTGTSEAAFVSSKGATGQLMTNLAAAGIDANAIDTVIISHYHGDHINGLLKADKSLAFPNAEILVPANEHQYYMDDGNMSRAPKGRIEDVFKNVRRVISGDVLKRLRTYEWDKEVIPGVHAVGTPGHTPGHTSHVVSSGAAKVYVQADVTHAPYLFARNPGWHAFYDQDPVMAEATRRKVYDMLVAEKMLVQGFHYPFPSVAHVEKSGTGYREIPVLWNTAL
ncbi:MBL fold metallo-hydrolase [Rhodoplanes sp. Z2-YC6860]|uniref:MBL fold metallo-hydrolase n=1 Tax=Rhodoplanes sp. Z2-YC6860 TaxID=674703 RepID=UPI00078B6C5A|nr:MBL fold metallo-hydrolase [Rhodoplanes sp. Z2-YC6860]AMN41726.1 metallo-beta-lactamase family protein [Rhodoplanes sp. Z2-YC6860]